AEWNLKMLSFDQIKASAPTPPPSATPVPAGQSTPGAAPAASATAPATDQAKPSIVAANSKAVAANGKTANGKPVKNGKPQPQVANTASGFQRAEVSAAGNGARPA